MMCVNLRHPEFAALGALIFLITGLALLIWPQKVRRIGERIEAWQFNTFPALRQVLFAQIWLAKRTRQLRIFPWLLRLQGLVASLVGLFLAFLLVVGIINPCP